ncbi:MAG: RluA family pseudouridine synthase [Oscillospiraceae bacterium]
MQDYLMSVKGYSRASVTKLKRIKGDILLNGEHIRMVDKIHKGDEIKITFHKEKSFLTKTDVIVPKVYEDQDIIIYNKPYGMPVHPSSGHLSDTLANAYANEYGDAFRPINRLDRDTTGLCVVAKNSHTAFKLAKSIKKEYTAVCCGKVTPLCGSINAPIVRPSMDNIIRAVRYDGQESITEYKVVAQNEKYSKVLINLLTGRTHQIRVHFSYLGFPLAGDSLYGGDLTDIKRQALCCTRVMFAHPSTDKQMDISIDIQEDMKLLI